MHNAGAGDSPIFIHLSIVLRVFRILEFFQYDSQMHKNASKNTKPFFSTYLLSATLGLIWEVGRFVDTYLKQKQRISF